jgi:hypothetical protein
VSSSPKGNTALIDYLIVTPIPSLAATDPESSFDAAVRAAAHQQQLLLREFGLRRAHSEHDVYRRLLDRLPS